MKSKKIVALALTAAMAISMASMTAFAGVEYNTGETKGDITKLTATVTLTKDEYDKLNEDSQIMVSELYDYGLDKNYTALNTGTKTFLGWDGSSSSAASGTEAPEDKTVSFTSSDGDKTYTATIGAVYSETTDDDKIAENLKKIEEEKAKKEALKSREDHLKAEDANHNATDNVNTGKGVETKSANVERKTDPIDPLATDTSEYHDLKAAGVNVEANELAWVYEVTAPTGFMSSTKNARAQLELPDGYTTTNYKVTVYHVKGWCSKQKVTGLDIGEHDVAFWANDFSPYVLILTPKGATSTGTSTNNPGTGDFSAVPVALLAAAALGATGFVAYKKRKAE